jgi:Rrf2 family cysteine metabolism transcriptional repressor
MKISKKAEYGLMAMIFLAKNIVHKKGHRIFSLREISAETKTSFVFLEKIFSKLEKAGLVKGIIGVRGGYVLAKQPQKINANDIVSLLDGNPEGIVNCSCCSKKGNCAAKMVWAKVEIALRKTLSSITLADLIK